MANAWRIEIPIIGCMKHGYLPHAGKVKVLQVIGLSAIALPAIEPCYSEAISVGHTPPQWNLPRPHAECRKELWKRVTVNAKSSMAVMLRKLTFIFLGLQKLNMAGRLSGEMPSASFLGFPSELGHPEL
jgi:hypothetical protein